jgi:site-specific recombinase XerD
VQRFLAWCDGEGVELAGISPGMVGQYLAALGGSAAKRNLHLSALRAFFDRLVHRHVVLLNPAASVSGVKARCCRAIRRRSPSTGPEADCVGGDHVHEES